MKNNKLKLLISSIVIVLPTVAALILKEFTETKIRGAWHFSWILPVFLVLLQIFLHLITFRENERVEQNKKIVNLTFWILPALSVYISALFMAISLGFDNLIGAIVSVLLGVMLIVVGNYTPKAKQNRTFGIKIKWTLTNERNWAATHRFTGKVWMVSGIVVLLGAFLPEKLSIGLLLVAIIPTTVAPIVYSYCYYRKELKDGTATKEDYKHYPKGKLDKKSGIAVAVVLSLSLVLVPILMFIGSITFTVGDEALEVKTTFGGAMTVDYDEILDIEYRDEAVSGKRVSGYASATLLYGWFKNDEFGGYTRYTYAKTKCAIVIHTADEVIVISDESVEATRALYDSIAQKIMIGGQ